MANLCALFQWGKRRRKDPKYFSSILRENHPQCVWSSKINCRRVLLYNFPPMLVFGPFVTKQFCLLVLGSFVTNRQTNKLDRALFGAEILSGLLMGYGEEIWRCLTIQLMPVRRCGKHGPSRQNGSGFE